MTTIYFDLLGYKNYNQADVIIYDECNNIIYNQKTYNGRITISLNKYNYYKLKAKISNDIIFAYFKPKEKLYLSFNKECNCKNIVTFILTDYYYNMPIEKGLITLWQKQ